MKASFNDFPGPITVSAALLLLLLLAETATAFVPFSTISVKNDGTARVNHHHQGVINTRGSSTRTYLDSLTPNMDNVNLIHHEHLVDGDEEDLDVDPLAAFISTSNEQDEEAKMDATNMRLAIQMAQSGYVCVCVNVCNLLIVERRDSQTTGILNSCCSQRRRTRCHISIS